MRYAAIACNSVCRCMTWGPRSTEILLKSEATEFGDGEDKAFESVERY